MTTAHIAIVQSDPDNLTSRHAGLDPVSIPVSDTITIGGWIAAFAAMTIGVLVE